MGFLQGEADWGGLPEVLEHVKKGWDRIYLLLLTLAKSWTWKRINHTLRSDVRIKGRTRYILVDTLGLLIARGAPADCLGLEAECDPNPASTISTG